MSKTVLAISVRLCGASAGAGAGAPAAAGAGVGAAAGARTGAGESTGTGASAGAAVGTKRKAVGMPAAVSHMADANAMEIPSPMPWVGTLPPAKNTKLITPATAVVGRSR